MFKHCTEIIKTFLYDKPEFGKHINYVEIRCSKSIARKPCAINVGFAVIMQLRNPNQNLKLYNLVIMFHFVAKRIILRQTQPELQIKMYTHVPFLYAAS